jgi:hypothetical protein
VVTAMAHFWAASLFLCLLILPISLAAMLFSNSREWAKKASGLSAGGVVISFVFYAFSAGAVPQQREQEAADKPITTNVRQASKHPASKAEALKNFRVGALSWKKSGFGMIMVASFDILNYNDFPVKDVEITCAHSANSGSKIDTNVRTVYEIVSGRSYLLVSDFNMGFIHSAVTSSDCRVTDFARV